MGWIRSGALFVDVGFDKEKIHAARDRKHLGYSSKFPPKNKRGNHNKKALFICISSSKSTLSPLFIHSGFNSISPLFCLLAFSIVKKALEKSTIWACENPFFLWMWNSYHQDLKINWIQFRTRKKVGLGLCTLHLHDFKIRIIIFSACFILRILHSRKHLNRESHNSQLKKYYKKRK